MNDRSPIARLTVASYRHPAAFLLGALALTLLGGWLASRLEIRSSFEELLPPDLPSVRHAKELAKRIGGDGTVLVTVESLDGPEGLKRAEAVANQLAQEYRDLGPAVVRAVDSNMRPIERWYADHWPLFASVADLEKARDELVKAIGKEKARLNPMLNLLDGGLDAGDEEDRSPITVSEPLLDPAKPSPRAEVEKRFARYVDGFMVAPDHRSVTIVVRPTGTSLGVSEARVLVDRMKAVAERHASQLAAEHLRVGFGGSFPILVAEYEEIIGDVFFTLAVVVAIVLASIVLFFREARPVLALSVILPVAIAVTFGLTWLAIGYLNTQTAFLGSIVVGNGINYGLIYLARVGQLRRQGVGLEEACRDGARTATSGTLLASTATAVSFGTLLMASNRGFKHFGFIGGLGMLLCWAATFALTPALLVAFEKIRPLRARAATAMGVDRLEAAVHALFARPKAILAVFGVLTVVSTVLFVRFMPHAMERNLDNLTNEVKGNTQLRKDNDRGNSALGQSIAGVIALLPSPELAEKYCDAVRARVAQQPRLQQLIDGCETVASVVPIQQERKLALIRDIRERLTDNVLSRLPPAQAARAREIRAELAAQRPVTTSDAPTVLVDRFRERDGTVGRIAFVRAKPTAKIELGPNLRDFVAGVRDVEVDGARYDAAGEQVIVSDLLEDIEREGPRTTVLSFVGVCLIVLVVIRSLRRSLVVLGVLTVGVLLMAGVAAAIDLKINFFNFIVYPITFGIAVDYGANVIVRMYERRNVLPSLVEVGGAVILCSWTTIVGYGSMLVSINRALRSFGWYAMLGEVTTLLTALLLLPAIELVFPPREWTESVRAPEPGDAS